MTLDVKSRRLRAAIPKRMTGMSLKRLQLRSRPVRLVRKAKFCGRELRTFLEIFSTSRSWWEQKTCECSRCQSSTRCIVRGMGYQLSFAIVCSSRTMLCAEEPFQEWPHGSVVPGRFIFLCVRRTTSNINKSFGGGAEGSATEALNACAVENKIEADDGFNWRTSIRTYFV